MPTVCAYVHRKSLARRRECVKLEGGGEGIQKGHDLVPDQCASIIELRLHVESDQMSDNLSAGA